MPSTLHAVDEKAVCFPPTRRAAAQRVAEFLPSAGRVYRASRSFDDGPDERGNVSRLSPYLTRRMVLEEDIVRDVLSHHSFAEAEKFVQEICWRTYWKGWLALRPKLWADYTNELSKARADLRSDSLARERYVRAAAGNTGVDCFDTWVSELIEHGYLRNHARMWFASIWIFTLKLPWVLGAELFYRLLLDADPATNTLSWRWVGGLHTRGKHYVATAENINRFTRGRFNPIGQLNENPLPKSDPRTYKAAIPTPLPDVPKGPSTGWLITLEDLSAAYAPVDRLTALSIAFLEPASDHLRSSKVRQFNVMAVADAASHAEKRLGSPVDSMPLGLSDVLRWASHSGVEQVVAMDAHVGETGEQLASLRDPLADIGIPLHTVRRPWDAEFYPHATRGFFPFKRQIPGVLETLLAP